MPNMLKNLWRDIREHPGNHTVLIGALVSIATSVCAWQYCRGYFRALSINIPYVNADNLIFVFEQVTSMSISGGSSEYGLSVFWMLFAHLILIFAFLVREKAIEWSRKIRKQPKSKNDSNSKKQQQIDKRYASASLGLTIIVTALIFVLNVRAVTAISSVFLVVALLTSTLILFYEIASGTHVPHYPISWAIIIIVLVNFFSFLGEFDGKQVKANEYRRLDTVCLSEPARELTAPKSQGGFSICGKLVFHDTKDICLKEDGVDHAQCRHREKYEITTIPSNP
jgi:hypothetical protein